MRSKAMHDPDYCEHVGPVIIREAPRTFKDGTSVC